MLRAGWPIAVAALAVVAPGRAADPAPFPLSLESKAVYEKRVLPFLKEHCWRCHDETSAKAGFQVDTLGTDFLAGKTADHWREAIDRIGLGTMPPKKEARPDPQEAFAVVEWVNAETRAAEKRAKAGGGRVPMRRLNRTEYTNTVRDLFHLDDEFARTLELTLPPDGKVDGFDRGGAALYVDRSQLQAYVDAARAVVDEALPAAPRKVTTVRHLAVKDPNLVRPAKPTTTMKEVMAQAQQLTNVYSKGPLPDFPTIPRGPDLNDFHKVRDGGVEVWLGPQYTGGWLNYLQRGDMARKVVSRDGWYRVKVRAGASAGSGAFAVDAVKVAVRYCPEAKDYATGCELVIDAPLDQPKVYEQLIYLKAGPTGFEKNLGLTWNTHYPAKGRKPPVVQDKRITDMMNAAFRAGTDYESAKVKKKPAAEIEAARVKRDAVYEQVRAFAMEFLGPVNHLDPEVDLAALPRLWFEYVELEGPIAEFPTAAAREIVPAGDALADDALRETFARFLPRAYRRAVTAEEVNGLVKVVHTMRAEHTMADAEAVRAAVRTVLTSPDFLFLNEPTTAPDARKLTDEALANRLAYFLWSTMPDAELAKLAAAKKLREPGVLAAQVRRMAADPKARQFVENFVGQWLRAREWGTVVVDTRQYPQYDDSLKAAGLREPYEFFAEMLRADVPVTALLDSDFAVVNERLAKHYGIAGVKGDEFRRVPLTPEAHRGGVLGMAGLLTYLSDGSRTQPVKRGAYVLDVLWNAPAPLPPPNAGDLPVVKGKNLTVRQRLEQHRSVATCASCHTRIDPLGLALENYDAVGAWRERQNGEGRKGEAKDPAIDASGAMPDGKPFADLAGFKAALVAEKARFLKGFTEKLLTYALGRPVGALDRETVAAIVAEAGKGGDRLRALLTAIVESPAFQSR